MPIEVELKARAPDRAGLLARLDTFKAARIDATSRTHSDRVCRQLIVLHEHSGPHTSTPAVRELHDQMEPLLDHTATT